MPFPPCGGEVCPGSANAQKRSKCRAQVTGNSPRDGGSGGDAFNCHSPAFFAFSARFLTSGCVRGKLQIAPARMALMRSE